LKRDKTKSALRPVEQLYSEYYCARDRWIDPNSFQSGWSNHPTYSLVSSISIYAVGGNLPLELSEFFYCLLIRELFVRTVIFN